MFYISLLCMRFFGIQKVHEGQKMKLKTKRKNMCYKNSNAKKVKCQTVVGL